MDMVALIIEYSLLSIQKVRKWLLLFSCCIVLLLVGCLSRNTIHGDSSITPIGPGKADELESKGVGSSNDHTDGVALEDKNSEYVSMFIEGLKNAGCDMNEGEQDSDARDIVSFLISGWMKFDEYEPEHIKRLGLEEKIEQVGSRCVRATTKADILVLLMCEKDSILSREYSLELFESAKQIAGKCVIEQEQQTSENDEKRKRASLLRANLESIMAEMRHARLLCNEPLDIAKDWILDGIRDAEFIYDPNTMKCKYLSRRLYRHMESLQKEFPEKYRFFFEGCYPNIVIQSEIVPEK